MKDTINKGDTVVVRFEYQRQGKPAVTQRLVKASRVDAANVYWLGKYGREKTRPLKEVWKIDPTPPKGQLTCLLCRNLLPVGDFAPSLVRNSVHSVCKPCHKNRYVRKYTQTNRDWHRRSRYGVTSEQFDRMLKDQAGCCAICGKHYSETWHNGALNVDHDHETGKVRALLCSYCNMALGYVKDDLEIVEKLATYIRKHKSE